jgi:DGQHR domain
MSNIFEKLVSGEEIVIQKKKRSQPYMFERVDSILLSKKEADGWVFDLKYANGDVKIKKHKPHDEFFEDKVWTLFANLNFKFLNKDRRLTIPCSNHNDKQIDVLAIDDETALFVECKSAVSPNTSISFKTELESIHNNTIGLFGELRKIFPDKKLKSKFIIATNGYNVSESDKKRMEDFGIIHFDEDIIDYYYELYKHLGVSTRYQLLGYLFSGQKIPELSEAVPAIEGKMGGHTYYSFLIEPERLLKLSYVLHRMNANKDEMPAYQRLIKKNRLEKIHSFVENGGFFPNSIIVNIDTKGSGLTFNLSSLQDEDSLSRIGLLRLPPKYKSVYVIDGQHRLYGYAESRFKSNHAIPVVAFIDLKKEDQVRLFMEINENQKSVSKELRNALDIDIYWNSENPEEQRKALGLQIANKLGEDAASPLYEVVILGENVKKQSMSISTETISLAIKRSGFLNKYKKNVIIEDGTLDKGSNDATEKILYSVISKSLSYIKSSLLDKWETEDKNGNYVCINVAIYGYIAIVGDIIKLLIKNQTINPKNSTPERIFGEMKYYLDPMIEYLKMLPIQKGLELKEKYGDGGKKYFWRTMQKAISEVMPDFTPEGLSEYWRDHDKRYNVESYSMIMDIELFMKDDFRKKLSEKYGPNWFKMGGIPRDVYDDAVMIHGRKNFGKEDGLVEFWDCFGLIDYRKIAIYKDNWRDLFEKTYGHPDLKGKKEDRTEWMVKLNDIRNKTDHDYSVKEEEHDYIESIHKWIIVKQNRQSSIFSELDRDSR